MRNRPILLSLAVSGLALAACNQQNGQAPATPATGAPIASLPLAEGAPPPLIAAPALSALPSAGPVKTVAVPSRERYRYIDRAYRLGEDFADSPPDYTVDYEGVRPWIWRSNHGDYRMIEPTPDGERIYYFDAGSDEPYLVRDPRYAYGYDQGGLAVIYDSDGRALGYQSDAADRAARYLARARALYRAAVNQQRQAAYAQAWRQRRTRVLDEQRAWASDQQRDAGWRDWHDAQQQQAPSSDRSRERAMRQAYAARTETVINTGGGGGRRPPPSQVQPFAAPGGQPPNPGFQGRREGQQQAAAQQQAQAAQQAQQRAQAQAEQQKQQAQERQAQADMAAERAARQQAKAAPQARAQQQAQEQKAQARAEHDARQARAAQQDQAQQQRRAQDAQAQAQKAQQKDQADRAGHPARQARAAQQDQAQQQHRAQEAQAQAQRAQQQKDQADKAEHAARQHAQDAQKAQAQARAAQQAHQQPQAPQQPHPQGGGQGHQGQDHQAQGDKGQGHGDKDKKDKPHQG